MKYRKQNNRAKEIENTLLNIQNELDKVHDLLVEGNSDGRKLNFSSHPNMSNDFDVIVKKVSDINKIIY